MEPPHEPLRRRPLSDRPVDPLPPALWPARTVHGGCYCRLEPLDVRVHADALFAASHGSAEAERIWDYLAYGPFTDEAAFAAWVRGCTATADPLFFAIVDQARGSAAGVASFLNIHPPVGSIEIGHIWFGPVLQNTAAATEALYLMMGHALDELGYRRLEWKCNALNAASRSAARRLGFAFEGIFYNHTIAKDRNRDTAWYSILDDEWPAIRANFDAWLAPDNFDADGRQRASLGELNGRLRAEQEWT